jgi:hypothetical protein
LHAPPVIYYDKIRFFFFAMSSLCDHFPCVGTRE